MNIREIIVNIIEERVKEKKLDNPIEHNDLLDTYVTAMLQKDVKIYFFI